MERKSFKKRCLLISLLVVICLTFSFGGAAAAEKIRLSMGTASTGTWIYMYCALLSETWKRYIPDLDVTVLATAGTTANYIPMNKGELDLAGASGSGDHYAMNGMYFTKDKLTNITSMLAATMAFNQAFTYADSPIKGWKDLEAKRVCLGARGSPTSTVVQEIFKVLGINPKPIFSTPSEAIEMIKDRRADAMVYGVGAPWSAVMDVATVQKIKFLPMTPEEQKKAADGLPHQKPGKIPANTYSFQPQDVPTTVYYQTVNARPGLDQDLVYKLVKVVWEHHAEIVKAAPAAKWVSAKDAVHMVAPLHPGAAKYYREIGIKIPDKMIWKK